MKFILIFLLLISYQLSQSQQVFDNASFSDEAKSIQVFPEGNPLGYPIITLGSGEKLEFHFDMMNTDLNLYRFGVVHCDHDWKQSDLEPSEYIQGFQSEQISTMDAGFSTTYNYVHYRFTYPTDMSKPKYSGNYALIVYSGYDIADKSSWIITFRFIIYESRVSVLSKVTPSSIIADRYTKQEVDFDIGHKDFMIYDAMRDVHVTVLQNFNWKNAVNSLKPIFMMPDVLTFDYTNGDNTFEAGSEYRYFEDKTMRYVSAETENVVLEDDGYHIFLRPDFPDGKKAYATWQDLNGAWLQKSDDASDSYIEADYAMVHFKMVMPEIPESEVIIEGKFCQFDSKPIVCVYDQAAGAYTSALVLKQGYYNYRYFVRDRYFAKDNLRYTEGSYANTSNDYQIIVYMYDRNLDCDRIIGFKEDRSVK